MREVFVKRPDYNTFECLKDIAIKYAYVGVLYKSIKWLLVHTYNGVLAVKPKLIGYTANELNKEGNYNVYVFDTSKELFEWLEEDW